MLTGIPASRPCPWAMAVEYLGLPSSPRRSQLLELLGSGTRVMKARAAAGPAMRAESPESNNSSLPSCTEHRAEITHHRRTTFLKLEVLMFSKKLAEDLEPSLDFFPGSRSIVPMKRHYNKSHFWTPEQHRRYIETLGPHLPAILRSLSYLVLATGAAVGLITNNAEATAWVTKLLTWLR